MTFLDLLSTSCSLVSRQDKSFYFICYIQRPFLLVIISSSMCALIIWNLKTGLLQILPYGEYKHPLGKTETLFCSQQLMQLQDTSETRQREEMMRKANGYEQLLQPMPSFSFHYASHPADMKILTTLESSRNLPFKATLACVFYRIQPNSNCKSNNI